MTITNRQPLSVESSHLILAPFACFYLTAVLVILPRTFLVRLAILPISLFFIFRASTQLDLATVCGDDGSFAYLNQVLLVSEHFLYLILIIDNSSVSNDRPRHTGHHMDIPTKTIPTYSQIQQSPLDLLSNITRCYGSHVQP